MEPNESLDLEQSAPRHAAKQIEIPADPELGNWRVLHIVLLVLAVAGFTALLVLIILNKMGPLPFDQSILDFMVDHVRSEKLTKYVLFVTDLAMPAALVVVLLGVGTFSPGPAPVVATVLAGAGGWLINLGIKFLVNRPRPPEALRLAVETSSSFPSSHAVLVMSFYGFLVWLVWHYQRNNAWRITVSVLLALVIALIGLTRIYLGVHWTSDVLAGMLLGFAWLVCFTRMVAARMLAKIPTRNQEEPARF